MIDKGSIRQRYTPLLQQLAVEDSWNRPYSSRPLYESTEREIIIYPDNSLCISGKFHARDDSLLHALGVPITRYRDRVYQLRGGVMLVAFAGENTELLQPVSRFAMDDVQRLVGPQLSTVVTEAVSEIERYPKVDSEAKLKRTLNAFADQMFELLLT